MIGRIDSFSYVAHLNSLTMSHRLWVNINPACIAMLHKICQARLITNLDNRLLTGRLHFSVFDIRERSTYLNSRSIIHIIRVCFSIPLLPSSQLVIRKGSSEVESVVFMLIIIYSGIFMIT